MKRILIVSHGHPDFNKGGAEVAAYNLFKELRTGGHDAYFLARTELLPHGGAAFSQRNSSREILFHTSMDDGFLFSNVKTKHLWGDFRELLQNINPDIIHFHHYFQIGIESIKVVRETLPQSRIILTLHEYLAICNRNGLMYKSNGSLCYKYTPRDCNGCFPEKSPGDFFLRENYFKNIFKDVDHFISPSHFLKKRYTDWGLPQEKVSVIENGQPKITELISTDRVSSERAVTRIGFFGQLNPYKGLDILLKAVDSLESEIKSRIVVDIHGANLTNQSSQFQKKVKSLLKRTKTMVNFCGSYEQSELPKLLGSVDWVVIPSIWWENSPMVIQEAFNVKVPLIVSDIGGMAEKITHEFNGLHFRAGKAHDLAQVISRVVVDISLRSKIVSNIKPPLSIVDCANHHLEIYGMNNEVLQKKEAAVSA